MWRHVAAGLLCLALVSCGTDRERPRLIEFENGFLQAFFQFHPPEAARAGLLQFQGRLGDRSERAIRRRRDELARMLVRVLVLQSEPLSWDERAESRVIEYAIRNELAEWTILQSWRHDPAAYAEIPLQTLNRAILFPGETPSRRLEGVLISLTELDSLMAALRANVTEPSALSLEAGLDRCRRLRRLLADDLTRWAPQAAGVDLELARSFSGALPLALSAVDESIRWLEEQAAGNSRAAEPLGPEKFIMKVFFGSMAEIRLSELERMAAETAERSHRALAAAAARAAPGMALPAALRRILGEPVPESQRLRAARRAVEEARQFVIRRALAPLPGEIAGSPLYTLQPIPACLRSPIETGWFEPPPVQENRARNGLWLVGGPLPGRPPGERSAGATFSSEADLRWDAVRYLVPGLYLHALYTAVYRSGAGRLVPERVLANRVTQRGWASYAEQAMWEAGFGRDDVAMELALYHRALVRACRFLAAVRFHARGVSLAEVERLFVEEALLPPAAAALEARAVALDPMRLAGALGRALILELRQEYYRARGGESPGAFHEAFLRYAPLPIPLIREALLQRGQPDSAE